MVRWTSFTPPEDEEELPGEEEVEGPGGVLEVSLDGVGVGVLGLPHQDGEHDERSPVRPNHHHVQHHDVLLSEIKQHQAEHFNNEEEEEADFDHFEGLPFAFVSNDSQHHHHCNVDDFGYNDDLLSGIERFCLFVSVS